MLEAQTPRGRRLPNTTGRVNRGLPPFLLNHAVFLLIPVSTAQIPYHIMYAALSNSYVMPAIFLNPVLFLISLNTILSRVLPPITVDAAQQPPPYSTFGPSAQHPHLDIHASEKLCWSYTFLIVCAQLAAFQRVSECREESRLKAKTRRKHIHAENGARKDNGMVFMTGNGRSMKIVEHGSET